MEFKVAVDLVFVCSCHFFYVITFAVFACYFLAVLPSCVRTRRRRSLPLVFMVLVEYTFPKIVGLRTLLMTLRLSRKIIELLFVVAELCYKQYVDHC